METEQGGSRATFHANNLWALTLLCKVFKDLSDEPVDDPQEFQREVELRWRLWRDQEGWVIKSTQIDGGYFELHLRQDVLGVRCFKKQEGAKDPESIARLRILLGYADGLTGTIEFTDDPDSKTIAARLLEVISYSGVLYPLERALSRGLSKYVTSDALLTDVGTWLAK